MQSLEKSILELRYQIPNVPQKASVPAGNSEGQRRIRKRWKPSTLAEGALPHWELAKKYDLIDFDLRVKLLGQVSRFTKGKGRVYNVP